MTSQSTYSNKEEEAEIKGMTLESQEETRQISCDDSSSSRGENSLVEAILKLRV